MFNEKFIDKNIADLCKEYSLIHGKNLLLGRVVPDMIDGLKPVARRLLYTMFKKDQGKNFRKVAAITGETIATIHMHSDTSVEDALVGLSQWWNNNIPLIEGQGNFGCHDKETLVLTREGWKYFKDITKDDKLASVNPEDGNLIFEHPINIMKYHYIGDLIIGKHESLDFAVTPNHKMVIRKYIKSLRRLDANYTFTNAQDIGWYSGLCNKFYQNKEMSDNVILEAELVDNGNILPEVEISMEDWVQFLGMYLADGWMYIHNSKGYDEYIIQISVVTKERKKKYYSEVLSNMGLNNKWSQARRGFTIWNKRVWKLLESYGLFGAKAPNKFIPDFIFDLDKSYIEKFLYGFAMGDGQFTKTDGVFYYTSSERMAQQLQILMLMCGKFSKLKSMEPKTSTIKGRIIKQLNKQYYVYEWSGKRQSIDRPKHITRVPYNDYVYCAEVPTYNTLITKRNECILLSGNSVSGDAAGASRYILARLSEYAYDCFFADWKESAVDMVIGADAETKEPLYLPSKYPNILLNGITGIGYGKACNLAPFNFKEIVEATIALMKNAEADILLIPDSPTGADIVGGNFKKIVDMGNGGYIMRCRYEIDADKNVIRIVNLPYQVTVNAVREKIADIKEKNGLPELVGMNDYSGKVVDLQLTLRNDVNPYKFMKRLIEEVAGLEKAYPVNIVVVNDYEAYDWSIKRLLNEWIRYRREQKRVTVGYRRTTLLAEQRTNDVKIFLMDKDNLETTINIFKTSRNKADIELRLIEKYRNSEIRMDSLQAKTLSDMRMHELSIESYERCLERRNELVTELQEVDDILNTGNGIDKVIINELRDGIKKFGRPRKSNVIPYKISIDQEVDGECILQLSGDGIITRKKCTNVDTEAVPIDNNGFAVKVGNDCAFAVIDENGHFDFIKVRELPVDSEQPLNRFTKKKLDTIVALLPFDFESTKCCTLISKLGVLKKIRISEMKASRKPCIELDKNDKLIRGIVTKETTKLDVLIYTKNGVGQRLDPNIIRITSFVAKGGYGFKLQLDDEISGAFSINPEYQYLCYVTTRGKVRLNLLEYLPTRKDKHDEMLKLISLGSREYLCSVVGCNKYDKLQLYYSDGTTEVVDVSKLKESTMSEDPIKVVTKNVVSTTVVKVNLI